MISSSNLFHKTHYEILGVKEDANLEEVRKAYRSAILCFHPDKQQNATETSNSGCLTENKFLDIQRAWETVGNPRSRALYDADLLTLRQDAAISEDVSLEDLTLQDSGDIVELSYPCGCGDYYFIDSLELTDTGCSISRDGDTLSLLTSKSLPASIVLPCGSCSLKVRLLINGDTRLQRDVHFRFYWDFSPTTGDLFISARLRPKEVDHEDQEKEVREDFYSVASHLSTCSSATSFEAFATARTVFSRSSSLDRIDFQDPWRHSVIQELSDCEGWPFGLYRKALLLPPLPKSPSDSWSWRKSARMVKMHR